MCPKEVNFNYFIALHFVQVLGDEQLLDNGWNSSEDQVCLVTSVQVCLVTPLLCNTLYQVGQRNNVMCVTICLLHCLSRHMVKPYILWCYLVLERNVVCNNLLETLLQSVTVAKQHCRLVAKAVWQPTLSRYLWQKQTCNWQARAWRTHTPFYYTANTLSCLDHTSL